MVSCSSARPAGSVLPPALGWWRDFAMRFVAALCMREGADQAGKPHLVPAPSPGDLADLIGAAPPMLGGEYLRADILVSLWQAIQDALDLELAGSKLPLQEFLTQRDNRWRLVGRVHFNLAENRKDADFPFAFMATYTSSLASHGALRHLPLGQALREYAGARDKAKLLEGRSQEHEDADDRDAASREVAWTSARDPYGRHAGLAIRILGISTEWREQS